MNVVRKSSRLALMFASTTPWRSIWASVRANTGVLWICDWTRPLHYNFETSAVTAFISSSAVL